MILCMSRINHVPSRVTLRQDAISSLTLTCVVVGSNPAHRNTLTYYLDQALAVKRGTGAKPLNSKIVYLFLYSISPYTTGL